MRPRVVDGSEADHLSTCPYVTPEQLALASELARGQIGSVAQ